CDDDIHITRFGLDMYAMWRLSSVTGWIQIDYHLSIIRIVIIKKLCKLSLSDKTYLDFVDIKTVQLGWPRGMPLVRKIDKDLWEVRIHLEGRIARVLFTISAGKAVLLHGFIKKSQATPKPDLDLAKDRMRSK